MTKIIIEDKLAKLRRQELQNKGFVTNLLLHCIIARDLKAIEALSKYVKLIDLITPTDLFPTILALTRKDSDSNLSIIQFLIAEIGFDFKNIQDATIGMTLLSEAAFYGSKRIVQFLIQQEFDINHRDIDNLTPLHKACITGSIDVVNILINKSAKLNIKNNLGETPLHCATLRKHQDIKVALIKAGAKKNIEDNNGFNYRELNKMVLAGDITIDPIELYSEQKILKIHSGVAHYCKAIYGKYNRENFFSTAITDFKGKIKELSASPDAELLQSLLMFLIKIYEIYKDDQSKQLQEYIIKIASTHADNQSLAYIYNIMGAECRANLELARALEYFELAEKNIKTNPSLISDTLKGEVLYNLGLCHKLMNISKAHEYFDMAETFLPNDVEILQEKVTLYLRESKLKEGLEQASRLQDRDLRDLYFITLYLHLGEKPLTDLLEEFNFARFENMNLSPEKHVIYKDICAFKLIREGNFTEAIKTLTEVMNSSKDSFSFTYHLVKILQHCQRAKEWDKGLEILQDFYIKNPDFSSDNFLSLKYNEFIFYEMTGHYDISTKILEYFNKIEEKTEIISSIISHLSKFVIFREINNRNYEQAKKYLEPQDQIEEKGWSKTEYLIERLKDEDKETQPLATEETVVENPTALIDWLEDPKEFAEELPDLDPKAIHQYFQQKKQALAQKQFDDISKTQSVSKAFSWAIDKNLYTMDGVTTLNVEGRPNFYATISTKLLSSLDHQTQELFLSALNKGLVTKNSYSVGVKFIKNKLIELKINDDLRLFTKNIYKNLEGKYLIIFNDSGNHERVKKVLQTSSIQTFEVESQLTKTDTEYNMMAKLTEGIDISSIIDPDNNNSDEGVPDAHLIGALGHEDDI